MSSKKHLLVTALAMAVSLSSGVSLAADRMVGVLPSDGMTTLLKRFELPLGSQILGLHFENNDSNTVFPEVSIIQGVLTRLSSGTVVSAVANVRETSPKLVTVLLPEPVTVIEVTSYAVAIRFPNGPGKQGPGLGSAIGANDVTKPNGSFIAGLPTEPLIPIRADLAIGLLTSGAGKAGPTQEKAPTSDGEETVPLTTYLAVGPNPANPASHIEFALDAPMLVSLEIYDIVGHRVRSLVRGTLPSGAHQRVWDGRDEHGTPVATGIYIVALKAGERLLKRKLSLLK